jgi:arylformamidase
MKIVDLTLPLYTGMPVYPGDPEVSIEPIQTIKENGWDMRRIQINSHDGTHVNAPSHGVEGGNTLNDYTIGDFCGHARIYNPNIPMNSKEGVLFRDQNIDKAIAEKIKATRPRFIGLSSEYEFDVDIEKDLLAAGMISFERLANLDKLPDNFDFYGMPLNIRGGDGSPVRAFAIISN